MIETLFLLSASRQTAGPEGASGVVGVERGGGVTKDRRLGKSSGQPARAALHKAKWIP